MTDPAPATPPASSVAYPKPDKGPLISRLADILAQKLRGLGTEYLHTVYRRFVQVTMIVTAAIYLFYLVWRALYSLNPDAMVFALAFCPVSAVVFLTYSAAIYAAPNAPVTS